MVYRLTILPASETLAALELTGIARGYAAADRMLKKAPVDLLEARPYCPGKFLIVISGNLASVEESLETGTQFAGEALFGTLFIANINPAVVAAINCDANVTVDDTLGVVESFSGVSIIDAADAAVKEVGVKIHSISLLQGLGGKGFALFTGKLSDVQAAIDAARRRIPNDMFVESRIIPEISSDIVPFLPGGEQVCF